MNTTNFTCNIPPPTPEECALIPVCNEHDQYAQIAIGSICSTSFQLASCLGGFMYVNPWNISAKPPFPFYNSIELPAQVVNVNNKNATCYQKYYSYTRACCPGYYCPPAMYCMMACTQKGSYCPSSDTSIYPSCSEAYIGDMSAGNIIQYAPLMGCGGSYLNDTMCPPGYYCPNSSEKKKCPNHYTCRAGSTEPRKCSMLQYCPSGSESPQNDTISASIVFVWIFLIILVLIFYERFKHYATVLFTLGYRKVYGKEFEQVRIEKNKRKKKNTTTLFTKGSSVNYRPYLSSDIEKFDMKLGLLGDNGMEIEDGSLAIASSASPLSGLESDSDNENDEKHANDPSKLNFFMDIQFENLSLHLKSNNKTILNECSGYLHCGTVNAIMGPSGAGKTSFLFTLCGKAAAYGKISGNIKINGEDKSIHDFQDVIGFVPQSDTMTAEMSVKEMLNFNSKFRLSSDVKRHYRKSVVRDVLQLLKIKRIRHSFIGDDVKRGISGGQQKRVNIGMELVSQPSVIFLDEPTSGLDSTTSNDVMEVLKLIADRGTLVLVVLHQPRYEIFSAFDNVILLAEGGEMVYMGSTDKAMPYFAQFGYVKPEFVNPADFVMDIISGTADPIDKPVPDLVTKWREMDTTKKWTMQINADYSNAYMNETCKDNAKYVCRAKLSLFRQIIMCTKRMGTVLWRQKTTLISDIVMVTLIGLIIGYITDSDDFQKLASNLFNVIITSSIVGCIISLRTFGNDRIMYWRFSSSGINRFAYYIGATVASAPWIAVHPFLFLLFYWPMARPRGEFLTYFVMVSLGMFCAQGLGQLISVIVDPNKSILVSVVLVMIMNFLCGFEPTLDSFNAVMKLVSDLSFARWQQEALWLKEINQWPPVFDDMKQYQSEYFGYSLEESTYQTNIAMMLILGFVFRIATYLALVFANRSKQM